DTPRARPGVSAPHRETARARPGVSAPRRETARARSGVSAPRRETARARSGVSAPRRETARARSGVSAPRRSCIRPPSVQAGLMAPVTVDALVTGATGFVGANLARELLREGATVRVLASPGGDR